MGVNMIASCITDDEACCKAAKQEIIRRYYAARCTLVQGRTEQREVDTLQRIMQKVGLTAEMRPVIAAARERAEETDAPALAIELPDGRIVTGKTSNLLGPSAALILNALKALGGIPKEMKLMSPTVIEPIQSLKCDYLGNHNPRLHSDEALIALSICSTNNEQSKEALSKLSLLQGCEAHSTVILSQVDEDIYRKLGINLTCEPQYHTKKLYHK
jgi:uncharacterized protein (UPF0371 family)